MITIEEFRNLKVGDKIQIVDHITDCGKDGIGWDAEEKDDSQMAEYLNKIVTVSDIAWVSKECYPYIRIKEDYGEWAWGYNMIEKKIAEEKEMSVEQMVTETFRATLQQIAKILAQDEELRTEFLGTLDEEIAQTKKKKFYVKEIHYFEVEAENTEEAKSIIANQDYSLSKVYQRTEYEVEEE